MTVSHFMHYLGPFNYNSTPKGIIPNYDSALAASIESAIETGKATLIAIPGKMPLVHPRQIIEWLLAMPKRAYLVPESLKAFLTKDTDSNSELVSPGPGRPKGTGLQKQDAPLVDEILQLMDEGKFKSMSEAALSVSDRAGGGGTLQSKAKRLSRLAKAKLDQNNSG